MKVLIVLAAVVVLGQAHLCVIFPKQRGNITGLNTQGSNNCLLVKDPPCGGQPAETPVVTFPPGMNATIIFQKNLDHFNAAAPGAFSIGITKDEGSPVTPLASVPDTSTPSGNIYTVSVPMPNVEMENAILQVVYATNNPNAPPEFYQCADINIMKM